MTRSCSASLRRTPAPRRTRRLPRQRGPGRAGGEHTVLLGHPVRLQADGLLRQRFRGVTHAIAVRSAGATTISMKIASCFSAACSPIRGTGRGLVDGRRIRTAPRALFAYNLTHNVQLNAQAAAGLPPRRHQRSVQCAAVHVHGPRHLQRSRHFRHERLGNYEVGAKVGFADGRGQFNIARFPRGHQGPADAGDRGHLLVATHLQRPGSELDRRRDRVVGAADPPLRLRHLAELRRSGIDTSLTSTNGASQRSSPTSRRATACRRCRSSSSSANATYSFPMTETVEGSSPAATSMSAAATRRSATRRPASGPSPIRPFGAPDHQRVHVRSAAAGL